MYSEILNRTLLNVGKLYGKIEHKLELTKLRPAFKISAWTLIIALTFGFILLFNILTPIISDDFAYLFVYGETGTHVHSLADIVRSQINHYYMWGGRSVVHFVAQFLLFQSSWVADLLNTLVYILYIVLLYMHIKGWGKASISLFILINMSVWFVQPVLGDTLFWVTGAANYLWGTTFILLFLLPYRLYRGKSIQGYRKYFFAILFFLFGIVAGWTNENTAAAMLFSIPLFGIYYYTNKWKIPLWSVLGFLGALIGFCFMILAPGNFERAGDASTMSLFTFAYRIYNSTRMLWHHCSLFLLAYAIIFVLYLNFRALDKKNVLWSSLLFLILAFVGVYAMILSPTFPRRALFGVVSYLIIAVGTLYYNLDFSYKLLRQLKLIVLVFGCIGLGFSFFFAFKEIVVFRQISEDRLVKISEAKKDGASYCEFDPYFGGRYIHGEDPFSGELMTRYYGIKIKLKGLEDGDINTD